MIEVVQELERMRDRAAKAADAATARSVVLGNRASTERKIAVEEHRRVADLQIAINAINKDR